MSSAPVNILLVDDEVRNLDVLEGVLLSPEYRLIRAQTADQALLLLLDGEFAVIVLDVQMPGMSGIELASLIKERKRTQHIPIIFLTAYFQDDKDIVQGYDSGAVDYLTKPINPRILRSKIATFVELFRGNRALTLTNAALEQEIAQRQLAEEALRRSASDLEIRVAERTAELMKANEELRTREAALRESESQARAAARAKDDFLTALSHELRTPLNPVLLLASGAARDVSIPPAVRADFEQIRKNVELEARLIDDLLDLTRITRGKMHLQMQTVDVHAVLESALTFVRSDMEEKQLELVLDLQAGQPQVWGDAVRLQQVFWNVLKNAAKFTPSGGRVVVATQEEGNAGSVAVRVSDNGIGLLPDEFERIFGAFSQGSHAGQGRPHRFGGLGLGLAISRMLVELHAGQIRASSPGRDRGSTFSITLPLAREAGRSDHAPDRRKTGAAADAPAPNGNHPPMPDRPRLRILLVDDHEPTRSALVQLLRRRNFDVTAAGTAAEARAAAQDREIDLFISDIGLPDGDGCELMREFRARQPGLQGIALSGYGMEDDVARSQDAGFAEHIIKPIDIEGLNDAIAAVSGSFSAKDERK